MAPAFLAALDIRKRWSIIPLSETQLKHKALTARLSYHAKLMGGKEKESSLLIDPYYAERLRLAIGNLTQAIWQLDHYPGVERSVRGEYEMIVKARESLAKRLQGK